MKRKITKLCFCVFAAAVFALLFSFAVYANSMQKMFDDELYGKVVRLHVIANSDSWEDQEAKIHVRDSILEYINGLTENAECAENACYIIKENLNEISMYVNRQVQSLGYSYNAQVKFSPERYPVRYYNSFAFPSGVYDSLRIVLGEGEGKNWWCVLYPSVCTALSSDICDILEDGGVSQRVTDIMCSDNVRFRFALFDLFN